MEKEGIKKKIGSLIRQNIGKSRNPKTQEIQKEGNAKKRK